VAWGQGSIIGPDFTLVMLRGRVYSSYTSLHQDAAASITGGDQKNQGNQVKNPEKT
jgi:hypothetical protein